MRTIRLFIVSWMHLLRHDSKHQHGRSRDFESLVQYNGDQFFVLRDFESYLEAQDKADQAYRNPKHWAQMSLINTANAGHFSSDLTIDRYVDDVWKLTPNK